MADLEIETRDDGVAVLRLNRPEKFNALSDGLLDAIPAAIDRLAVDDAVRCIVITGNGPAFCAGADLQECSAFGLSGTGATEDWLRAAQAGPVAIRHCRKPTIAAINGAAVGAGFGITLSCDIRYAAPSARMATPFVRMGLPPDYGISYFLPRLIGAAATLEILLTGRFVSAAEALALGIVTRVEDDVLAAALETATAIASMPPRAVQTARQNMYRALEQDLETTVLFQEPATAALALAGEEFAEQFAAYRQKIVGSSR